LGNNAIKKAPTLGTCTASDHQLPVVFELRAVRILIEGCEELDGQALSVQRLSCDFVIYWICGLRPIQR
jgi:hypothetical protein